MTETTTTIAFYQVAGDTPAAVDAALPPLLTKAVAAGHKLAILCPTAERLHRLDEALWSYQSASFLPHSTLEDAPDATRQPILLLTPPEMSDNPAALTGRLPILLAGTESAQPALPSTERTLYLFPNHPDVLPTARNFFKTLKGQGATLTYWQQDQSGRWAQKTGA